MPAIAASIEQSTKARILYLSTGRRASAAATGLPPIAFSRKPNSERWSSKPTITASTSIHSTSSEIGCAPKLAVRPVKKSSSLCGIVDARRRIDRVEGRGVA